jgi:hypothetical protein
VVAGGQGWCHVPNCGVDTFSNTVLFVLNAGPDASVGLGGAKGGVPPERHPGGHGGAQVTAMNPSCAKGVSWCKRCLFWHKHKLMICTGSSISVEECYLLVSFFLLHFCVFLLQLAPLAGLCYQKVSTAILPQSLCAGREFRQDAKI